MKFKKTSKILSTVLALAISACSLTGMAGVTSSAADGSTTTDYSAVYAEKGEQWRLKINDYYTTLNMYDGVGLGIKEDGVLAMDTDWRWQVNSVDTAVELKSPYAIYNIAENTEFTAVFSDTTDMSKINALVSRDMVSWTDAEPDISGKTLKIGTPNEISFVRIELPTDNNRSAGIKSVTYTKAENAANVYRYDYATITGGSMLGSGKEDPNVLVNRGVWESRQLILLNSGVFRPNDNDINNATTADSFNGYATYKVQPGTRFGFTVTGNRGLSAVAGKLGFEKETDWTIEVYGSADNVAFEKLNVKPVFSARYSNFTNNDAKRSADWNFIVPDNMVYIKLKFPITQNLSTQMVDGSPVWPWSGNDLFEINRVEYTGLKYDYRQENANDYYISGNLSNDTKAAFGIYSYGGGFSAKTNGGLRRGFNTNWSYQAEQGGTDTNVVYKVQPGTTFYTGFRVNWEDSMKTFLDNDGHVIQFYGRNLLTEDWTKISPLITNDNYVSGTKYYDKMISAEDNKYRFIKIRWDMAKINDTHTGDDVIDLIGVDFTAADDDIADYDYTATGTGKDEVLTTDDLAKYGMYAINSKVIHHDNGSFDCDGDSQRPIGHPNTWITYNVKPGTAFYATFYNRWNLGNYVKVKDFVLKIQGSNGDGEWSDITSITVTKENKIAVGNKYSAYVSAAQNNYKFIRVLWPAKADDNYVGDATMCLTGVAFTPYSEDAPTYKNGDVNGDNEVDLLDYVKLKKIIAGVDTSTGADPDLDGNGVANGKDLTLLRKYLIGAIDTL